MNDTANGAERRAGGAEPEPEARRGTPVDAAPGPSPSDLIEIHDPAVGVTILVSVPPLPLHPLPRRDRPLGALDPAEETPPSSR